MNLSSSSQAPATTIAQAGPSSGPTTLAQPTIAYAFARTTKYKRHSVQWKPALMQWQITMQKKWYLSTQWTESHLRKRSKLQTQTTNCQDVSTFLKQPFHTCTTRCTSAVVQSRKLFTESWYVVISQHDTIRVLDCPHHYTWVKIWVYRSTFSWNSYSDLYSSDVQRRASGLAIGHNHRQRCQYCYHNWVLTVAAAYFGHNLHMAVTSTVQDKRQNQCHPFALAPKDRTIQEAKGSGTSRT